MREKLSFLKSTRIFQVWEYQASHGQLLIRSPKTPATNETPEFITNIDLVFIDVAYMALPHLFRGLKLESPSHEELRGLKTLLGEAPSPDHVKILESDGRRFPIIASSLSVFENDWDIFESPFEFRSNYRDKP